MSSQKPRVLDHLWRRLKRDKGESSSAAPDPVTDPGITDASSIQKPPESNDTHDSLKRYAEAAEELKEAIKRKEKDWESFQIQGLKGEADEATQEKFINSIYEFFDKRRSKAQDKGLWGKARQVAESFFTTLSPAMKNFLTVASSAQSVRQKLHDRF